MEILSTWLAPISHRLNSAEPFLMCAIVPTYAGRLYEFLPTPSTMKYQTPNTSLIIASGHLTATAGPHTRALDRSVLRRYFTLH